MMMMQLISSKKYKRRVVYWQLSLWDRFGRTVKDSYNLKIVPYHLPLFQVQEERCRHIRFAQRPHPVPFLRLWLWPPLQDCLRARVVTPLWREKSAWQRTGVWGWRDVVVTESGGMLTLHYCLFGHTLMHSTFKKDYCDFMPEHELNILWPN